MNIQIFNSLFNEVFTEQTKDDFYNIVNIIEGFNPSTIVEIGMKNGGTLNFWRHLLPSNGLLIGIDSNYDIKWDVTKDPRIKIIIGKSQDYDTYKQFQNIIGGKEVDFLYIDGDHSYPITKSDFLSYGWHVRKGGLIILHDIFLNSEGEIRGSTKHYWNEIKSKKGIYWDVITELDVNTGTGIVVKL